MIYCLYMADFNSVEKQIQELTQATAKGFASVTKDLDEIKDRVGKLENGVVKLEEHAAKPRNSY